MIILRFINLIIFKIFEKIWRNNHSIILLILILILIKILKRISFLLTRLRFSLFILIVFYNRNIIISSWKFWYLHWNFLIFLILSCWTCTTVNFNSVTVFRVKRSIFKLKSWSKFFTSLILNFILILI